MENDTLGSQIDDKHMFLGKILFCASHTTKNQLCEVYFLSHNFVDSEFCGSKRVRYGFTNV